MATVTKRDGGWRARYREPSGKQREKRFDRKVDAQRWLDEQTTQHVTGTYVAPELGKITVAEWSERWLATKVSRKASTRDRYAGILRTHIIPVWGTTKIADVAHEDVQDWISGLTVAGQSAGSVVKIHRVMSQLLGYAVRSKRLASNPAKDVDLPKVTPAEHRYLNPAQVADLANAAGDKGRLVILVLAYCGLRWGELAALRVTRVDLLRRRIHVAESVTEVNGGKLDWGLPKDWERRWVPIPRFLADDLAGHLVGKAPEDLVFTSPRGAVLRVGGAKRSWFNRAVIESGVPAGFHPHELRHTAASLAVSAGANVKAVQKMLGHKKASMTLDTYADLFDEDLEAVAERLDEIARRVGETWADAKANDLDEPALAS
ncbi:tyrosine-type recombinase/integrase [Jiangella alkaliphila]|uniref:Site-specific recombinase XerD n=1 Tax=Jiangella alkaliphila TaxID=419479 RepID=A0A1H2GAH3_9ACTN|nr:site-specific integrase [Jiangella alkaliphila]SDU16514.1 Site-specific recombinase XerD [Jiangella alkaliphila]